MTAIMFGAVFTDGYELGMISMVLPLLAVHMNLSSFWLGFIGSSALIGLFFGSLILGWISDHFGRKKIFVCSFIIITIATIFEYFVRNKIELVILRFLIGFGIGGDYSAGHTMLAEILPKRHRGSILGSFSVIWTVGYVCSTLIGYLLINKNSRIWRWMLVSAVLPAIIVLISRIGTPESPRWLMTKYRMDEAFDIIKKYINKDIVINNQDMVKPTEKSNFLTLFNKKFIRLTLFNCLFYVCLVIPYFAIYTFLPIILKSMDITQSITTDLLLNFFLLLGAFIGIGLTIKLSRRHFLIGSFIILTISLTLLSFLSNTNKKALNILCIIIFAIFTLFMSAVCNLVVIFPAESFPTHIRSTGTGFVTAVSRFGSATGTFLLPLLIEYFKLRITLLILSSILVFGTIISILWAPETKLTDLDELNKTVECVDKTPANELEAKF
ncbi:unnamed protein product [Didymodactylos carnosus]|uniref:Major facilitator superfamily (MFS) profile domain-containing protein n=1 Tax=Didymodactylos carnosus TaxID=1234261 RepID=A0A815PGT9_9BILA|nr:unnamed protein product [Didymodactylos carnosus]CAF1448714.1 unnamed protein product [Didymodactylos carnosus]CAF4097339.1 unnamed protein product [Didymodactylos carnosus]CAF4322698.1 unnamed protein product [Didymodactylos carnosus]